MDQMLTFLPLVLLMVVMFLFMRRNAKRQKEAQEKKQSQLLPGTEIMTASGLYGKIISVDRDTNKMRVELSPGNDVTMHIQAVASIESADEIPAETPTVPDDVSSLTEANQDVVKPVEEKKPNNDDTPAKNTDDNPGK